MSIGNPFGKGPRRLRGRRFDDELHYLPSEEDEGGGSGGGHVGITISFMYLSASLDVTTAEDGSVTFSGRHSRRERYSVTISNEVASKLEQEIKWTRPQPSGGESPGDAPRMDDADNTSIALDDEELTLHGPAVRPGEPEPLELEVRIFGAALAKLTKQKRKRGSRGV